MNLLIPNQKISDKQGLFLTIGTIVAVLLFWTLSNSTFLPKPGEILRAMYDLVATKRLIDHFILSISLCLKAILISAIISMVIAYASRLPVFSSISHFLTKFRFLPTVGLSFLFMKLTGNAEEQKQWLLIFGISAFLVDSIYTVVNSTSDDELNYARTLRMNEWQVLWEVIIVGKISQIFGAIRSNFAIAWMMLATVENICKSSGGIGVILSDLNKWFRYEYVYGIQIYILLTGILIDFSLNKLTVFLFPYTTLNIKR